MAVTRTRNSSAGIDGTQIRDDSVTGDDVDEFTLKIPQAYHSSGDHSSASIVYLALPGRNGWSASFSKANHQLVAPFNGMVIKVLLRPTTGDNINACIFQVRTNYENIAENGEPNVVQIDNSITASTSEGTTEFICNPPVSITKGHAFSFAILKGSGTGYGITDATIVVEWDLST